MQSGIDAEHIISMGALSDRVTITGNTKYDETYVEVSEEEKQQLRHEFHFDGKGPVIVAGSTHNGEEEIILRIFGKILKEYPDARLLLAVREITRAPSVRFLVKHLDTVFSAALRWGRKKMMGEAIRLLFLIPLVNWDVYTVLRT